MTVELTIFSHKIKIFVLFLSSFFVGGWGGGGGGVGGANYILICDSKEHTQSTNKRKMKKKYEYIIKYIKINTHSFLFFSLFKPVTHLI